MPRDPRLYLDDILDAITRIREYTEPIDYEEFTRDRPSVTRFRYHHGIDGRQRARLEKEGVYTVEQAATILEVSRGTVIRWIELGLLQATQLIEGAPWRVQLSEADRTRLKATDAPKGWLPLKGAARALGVSQQTVLHRLKSGQLEGVRVQQGARSAWRIRVPSTSCEKRPSLFWGFVHEVTHYATQCPRCGSRMEIIAFIEEWTVIRKILQHLNLWERPQRAPPPPLLPHKLEAYLSTLSPRQAQRVRASTDSLFWDDVPVYHG